MSNLTKVGVVLGGYAAALCVAYACVYVRQLHISECDARASPGMYAWGDLMLFVAAFSFAALVPTALGLYFLRPVPVFWTILSVALLMVAATGALGAGASALVQNLKIQRGPWAIAGMLGFLGAMGAPLLAMGFFTCAAFAPARRPRLALLLAAGLECVAGAYFFIHLWLASGPHGAFI
jgi:hypothetical protein